MATIARTRYARSGEVSIAYQVVGDREEPDLVLAPGFPSHLEHAWEQPRLAHFYRRLASFSRLILFDKRGLGLSDRVAEADLPGVEQRLDDVRAVLDAAGSERAVVMGISDGGPIAARVRRHLPRARAAWCRAARATRTSPTGGRPTCGAARARAPRRPTCG